MPKVVGIQFRGGGRIYYFDPLEHNFAHNEYAIVETIRGLELGKVILANHEIETGQLGSDLKPVIKKATTDDLKRVEENDRLAKEALQIFKNAVSQLNLEMKPLLAEYTIERSKIVFSYTADDRVDFRELLKALAPEFKARVELRQIGTREAARYIGGLGTCGNELCCKNHLRNFTTVTMKMAKDQAMSLNTNKISGACGKLMCCIAYENDMYNELRKEVPSVGTYVKTPNQAECKVIAVDYIKKTVRVIENGEGMPVTYHISQIEFTPKDLSRNKTYRKNGNNEGNH